MWRSACPKLYFPLDSASEGTASGNDASTLGFTSGKVNDAFYFPNPAGTVEAYFSLGHYPSTSYCFPEPEKCQEGVTFAFWMKILGLTSKTQGFITTVENEGPGFITSWYINVNDNSSSRMQFQVLRDSDSMIEIVRFYQDKFEASFGFGVWVHYIITYKYGADKYVNGMEVYFNGQVHPETSKTVSTWWADNTLDYNGNLQLGTITLGHLWKTANMYMDDLIIFEEEIPCDDAYRLYNAYLV